MLNLKVFIDGSVNNNLKIGYGACLLISDQTKSSINDLKKWWR